MILRWKIHCWNTNCSPVRDPLPPKIKKQMKYVYDYAKWFFFYSAISWWEQISYFLMRWWRNLFCIKPPHRRCRLHERRRIYLSWNFYCAWFTTILGHKGQHIHIIGISLINHTIICKCIFILPFDICHQI